MNILTIIISSGYHHYSSWTRGRKSINSHFVWAATVVCCGLSANTHIYHDWFVKSGRYILKISNCINGVGLWERTVATFYNYDARLGCKSLMSISSHSCAISSNSSGNVRSVTANVFFSNKIGRCSVKFVIDVSFGIFNPFRKSSRTNLRTCFS